ncbi:MAG TPA: hypothetical protein VMK12_16360 [Anaeromyxobacteraceae bacterium]|nr:hypothetical protein [Anaeromyxobacteraceae bacterium]
MELRDRVHAPIAKPLARDESTNIPTEVELDFGGLVQKLILSEEIVVESLFLSELPIITRKFGYDGTSELLKSGRIKFLTQTMFTGNIGQYTERTNGPVLPWGCYCFSAMRASSTKEMISTQLHQIDEVSGLRVKQAQKLRKLTSEHLAGFPDDTGRVAEQQFKEDFANNVPALKRGISLAVQKEYGVELTPQEFSLNMVRLAESDWRAESDLGNRLGLGEEELHEVVGNGLSAACALNVRLQVMQALSAVSGFQNDGELPLLDDRLAYLARQIDPNVQEGRFVRVREITGIPDPDPDPDVHDVDLPRLLEITSGPEVLEFRRWLRTVDAVSDEELADAFHPVRDALGEAVRTPIGKGARFATTTVVGAVFPPAAIPLGLLDTFLTEKVLPGPGPTAFLSQLYPSIFE